MTINLTPLEQKFNRYSFKDVHSHDKKTFFTQDEILYSDLDRKILELIREALDKSGYDGWGNSIEVGFFITLNGEELVHEFVTSNLNDGIEREDNDIALNNLLQKVDINELTHLQYYHTHPRGGYLAFNLSRDDIRESLYLEEQLSKKTEGMPISIAMHAIPHELSKNGHLKTHTRPTREVPNPPVKKKEIVPTILRISNY